MALEECARCGRRTVAEAVTSSPEGPLCPPCSSAWREEAEAEKIIMAERTKAARRRKAKEKEEAKEARRREEWAAAVEAAPPLPVAVDVVAESPPAWRGFQTAGLIGAGLLACGSFAPIISAPILGSITYINDGKGWGMVTLCLALAATALAYRGRAVGLALAGLAALGLVGWTLYALQAGLLDLATSPEFAASPILRGLARRIVGSVRYEWGWGLLLIGAGLILGAGIAGRTRRPTVAAPGSPSG